MSSGPRLTHQMEQLGAALENLGRSVYAPYYRAMIDSDLPQWVAVEMIKGLQAEIVRVMLEREEPGGE